MSNDKTCIELSWYRDTKVDRFNGAVRLSQHYAKQSYTVAEARSLAAALVRHADAIDPPNIVADKPEVAGWLVEMDEVAEALYTSWADDEDGEGDACNHANSIGGTVRELHLGPVIHDASGPKQCGFTRNDELCWRVADHLGAPYDCVFTDNITGQFTGITSKPLPYQAIQAAVRDRDEREGR